MSDADKDDGNTMLSRSGNTDQVGKLIKRIDVPCTEELEDAVVSRAVAAGKPRAEYIRDLVTQAMEAPQLIGLPADLLKHIEVLATISGVNPNALAVDLLRRAVRDGFSMVQSMARQSMGLQSDQSGRAQG